jgi:hypothetical protein
LKPQMNNDHMSSDRVRSSVDLLTQRLGLVRALFIVSVATNGERNEINKEFHQAVGGVLEGVPLSKLKLTLIDRKKVKEEAAWLRDK